MTYEQPRDGERLDYKPPKPPWWHSHGDKLQPIVTREGVVLWAQAARVRIVPQVNNYILQWELDHFGGRDSGYRTVDRVNLFRVFGLDETSEDSIVHMEQGLYARWNSYLNIPGIGTGNDRDPNISVYTDTNIRRAVIDLLRRNR